MLLEDSRRNAHDSLAEDWARPVVGLQVGQGRLSGRLIDLNGRLNLNDLLDGQGAVDPLQRARFRRLLALLDLPQDLSESLLDWLDADSRPRAGGGEDGTYAGLGYRTANAPLQALAELSRVRGYTPEVVQRLRPHVAVLPRGRPLNVNTASAEVLRAVVPQLGADLAASLQQEMAQGGFPALADFIRRLQELGVPPDDSRGLGVRSHDFLLRVWMAHESRRLGVRIHLHREGGRIRVLSRQTDPGGSWPHP